jgi:hypothetical protein
MAANVAFNPKSLDLGLFGPGTTEPFDSVVAAHVSAAATMSASIVNETFGMQSLSLGLCHKWDRGLPGAE